MSKCECNYHLGMGPNLKCPLHGEANFEEIKQRQETASPVDELVSGTDIEFSIETLEMELNKLNSLVRNIDRIESEMLQNHPNMGKYKSQITDLQKALKILNSNFRIEHEEVENE